MHQADPSGVHQHRMVSIMLECSTGGLRARAAFVHHPEKGHTTVKQYADIKGLKVAVRD